LSAEELLWLNDYHARVRREVGPSLDEATRAWLDAATAPLSL
jgi:Xaa-Pro aminopeptidase